MNWEHTQKNSDKSQNHYLYFLVEKPSDRIKDLILISLIERVETPLYCKHMNAQHNRLIKISNACVPLRMVSDK